MIKISIKEGVYHISVNDIYVLSTESESIVQYYVLNLGYASTLSVDNGVDHLITTLGFNLKEAYSIIKEVSPCKFN